MNTTRNAQAVKVAFGLFLPVIVLILCFSSKGVPLVHAQSIPTPESSTYFDMETQSLPDGNTLEVLNIHGPSAPPEGFELQRQSVDLQEGIHASGVNSLPVPAYRWVYGCSAVSGSMIAAYYDRTGYSKLYTGPTNGGVMPMAEDVTWGTWKDSLNHQYPNNPLIASHIGLDGRTEKGSLDDYWVSYLSSAADPFTGKWSQHAWGDAVGDYMRTSQVSAGNVDGSSRFSGWLYKPDQLTCEMMENWNIADATVGRKNFYLARGYSVTECYNQKTDNTIAGGFSYNQFKAEIDAGRPVFLNLAGHSIVGLGYSDPSTIYINDTWDNSTHQMPWGGSYANMQLLTVSMVNITSSLGAFGKIGPLKSTSSRVAPDLTLSWYASDLADHYEYCVDTSNNKVCDSAAGWVSTSDTSVTLSPGTLVSNKVYFWQVRAIKDTTITRMADEGLWWSFKTLPLPVKPELVSPASKVFTLDTTPDFSWNSVLYGETYQLEVSTSKKFDVPPSLSNEGSSLAYTTGLPLADGIYYWRVRAVNHNTEAGAWSSSRYFTVDTLPTSTPLLNKPLDLLIAKSLQTLTWYKPTGAAAYQVEYSTDPAFSTYTLSVLQKSTSYKPVEMTQLCTPYYWRVKAFDAAGNDSGWSTTRSLQICP